MQRCGYLLERLCVPVDHHGPRLHQDVQCVFLDPVKQLLKWGHQSVIHLPSQLLINTKAPPGRAEKICGVKELRRREETRGEERRSHKTVLRSETFLFTTAALSRTQSSLSLITAALTPHKCQSVTPLGLRIMERSSKCHCSGELKVNWRKIGFTVRYSGPELPAFLPGPAAVRLGGSGWLDWRKAGGVWLTCFYGSLNLSA